MTHLQQNAFKGLVELWPEGSESVVTMLTRPGWVFRNLGTELPPVGLYSELRRGYAFRSPKNQAVRLSIMKAVILPETRHVGQAYSESCLRISENSMASSATLAPQLALCVESNPPGVDSLGHKRQKFGSDISVSPASDSLLVYPALLSHRRVELAFVACGWVSATLVQALMDENLESVCARSQINQLG